MADGKESGRKGVHLAGSPKCLHANVGSRLTYAPLSIYYRHKQLNERQQKASTGSWAGTIEAVKVRV